MLETTKLNIHRLGDLLEMDFPAGDSLLGNELLDKSGAMLITGPQKIGKSLFATQLALCLADRRPFVGFDPTATNQRVLMLQAEVGESRMQQRLRRQTSAFSKDALGNVFNACTFSTLKLDHSPSVALLIETVLEYKP